MTKFILGKKSGMTQLFDENGNVIPATVIECEPMYVLQNKTVETDGYNAVKVASGSTRAKLVNKPDAGQFKKAGVEEVKKYIREFEADEGVEYALGQEIKVSDMFSVGDAVDVSGVSKGKGYAGNIKRHGQKGGPSGHGSMYHRRVGSMGANSTPARVLPGKKMPGHMGAVNCTVQNLDVVMVDGERGILVLRGAIPGPKGGLVTVKSSVKAK
ncbi:MAG: 50S ribosomal protein L3 [Clostridia bacterium]|nr:50S ribosomal protein L3 [Clostridia bacterium]